MSKYTWVEKTHASHVALVEQRLQTSTITMMKVWQKLSLTEMLTMVSKLFQTICLTICRMHVMAALQIPSK